MAAGAAVQMEAAPLAAPALHKRPLGRHVNNATESKTMAMEAHSKRFSVKIDTEADLQWVMQVGNGCASGYFNNWYRSPMTSLITR